MHPGASARKGVRRPGGPMSANGPVARASSRVKNRTLG
ncbi:hypothetical protein HMPREF0321_2066 [Dermacoccus sp. Ellin185]|nr:hypothetical protein HMPREF0321_2066 [Dermacoccus sp. Ellin185]